MTELPSVQRQLATLSCALRNEFAGVFEHLKVVIEPNPLGDVYLQIGFEARSEAKKVLIPIAGFKSDFLPFIESIPIPISVAPKEVELEILELSLDGHPRSAEEFTLYRLDDGNKGLQVSLPDETAHEVVTRCRLAGFLSSAPMSTDLVIGIFPPWGWSGGQVNVILNGALSNSTWGYKMVAGIHNLKTGKRVPRFWASKHRPSPYLRTVTALRFGLVLVVLASLFLFDFLSIAWKLALFLVAIPILAYFHVIVPSFKGCRMLFWELNLDVATEHEIRFRARAARFKGLALFSPFAPFWIAAGLLISPLVNPVFDFWKGLFVWACALIKPWISLP